MGYSINLIDRTKSITEEIFNNTVKQLPKRLLFKFDDSKLEGSKQDWGWSVRTDLSLIDNKGINYISVSGSFGISGKWALDMVISLQQLLQRQGYKIEIFSTDFGFSNKELYEWMGYDSEELIEEEQF